MSTFVSYYRTPTKFLLLRRQTGARRRLPLLFHHTRTICYTIGNVKPGTQVIKLPVTHVANWIVQKLATAKLETTDSQPVKLKEVIGLIQSVD